MSKKNDRQKKAKLEPEYIEGFLDMMRTANDRMIGAESMMECKVVCDQYIMYAPVEMREPLKARRALKYADLLADREARYPNSMVSETEKLMFYSDACFEVMGDVLDLFNDSLISDKSRRAYAKVEKVRPLPTVEELERAAKEAAAKFPKAPEDK